MDNATVVVRMLKDFGAEHKKDNDYEIDSKTAQSWIEAGLAEKKSDHVSIEEGFARLQKNLDERDSRILKTITEATKPATKFFAEAKSEEPLLWGEFLNCVKDVKTAGTAPAQREKSFNILDNKYGQKTALQSVGNASGSEILVPPQFVSNLFRVEGYAASVRPRATNIPMTSDRLSWPALDQYNTPSAGNTAFTGGVAVYWENEISQSQSTNPKFNEIKFEARRLSANVPVSKHLLQDSPISADQLVSSLFAEAINQRLDYDFLRGDGSGRPLGILNAPSFKTVSRTTSNLFKLADAAKMVSSLPMNSFGKATWIMNQTVFAQLVQLKDASDRVVWVPNAGEMPALRLFGMEVVLSENLPVLGTQGDVILCDLSKYGVATRTEMTIGMSEHVYYRENQNCYKVEMRCDGQPLTSNVITLADGATTISHFIGLAA